MTEKRFTYIKNSSITQYQSIPIQKIGKGKPFHCQGLVDELNKLWNENEQLKKELSDIGGQLLMLDNCDNWDYDRMKHTVREIAEIIGYNGTINPKKRVLIE